MDEKSYKVDEMINSLVDLASEEVRKAKQKGYFGKDLAESVCCVIKAANSSGEMGTNEFGSRGEYGNRSEYGNRNSEYSHGGEYGHYDEDYEMGEYGARGNRSGRGQRYGRTGQRYG